MSKSTSEAKEILSNICLTSKEERERRERRVEEAEVDWVAPIPESQLPTLHTSVPYGFDDDLYEIFHGMSADFGKPLKGAGPLPQEYLGEEEEEFFKSEIPLRKISEGQNTGEILPKLFKEEELKQEMKLKPTPQLQSVNMIEEEEDQQLAFKTTEASSSFVEVKTSELSSTYIGESLPSNKLVDGGNAVEAKLSSLSGS